MKTPSDPSAGFSLVEVLVAVLILGVTGLALLDGLQSNVLQAQRVGMPALAHRTVDRRAHLGHDAGGRQDATTGAAHERGEDHGRLAAQHGETAYETAK